MAQFRNIILDWSGTLVDDFEPVLEAVNEIFIQYGKPPLSEQRFRETFFLPFTKFYEKYLPEATMVELEHHYHSSFKLLQQKVTLLPHAREFLEYCRAKGIRLFLLSTIHAEHYEVQGERLGVKGYFEQAYVQALDKRKTILKLLADHDLEPGETMFVGDMQHDLETAHHGGITACAVLTGYDSLQKLQEARPDLIFRDLLGLRHYLEEQERTPDCPPIATVGALVQRQDGKVLMIRTFKWSNLWGIPGGKIRSGEGHEQALRREVLEETGLELAEVKFLMVQDCINSPEFYKRAHFLLLNYVGRAVGDQVVLNEEAEEYRWVTAQEALEMLINQPTRILLEHWLKHTEAHGT